MTNTELFYKLIEETPQTFYPGLVVTAQVVRVVESRDSGLSGRANEMSGFAICKLDNGLDAKIERQFLDSTERRRIEDLIQVGHVITGRVHEIRDKDEGKF